MDRNQRGRVGANWFVGLPLRELPFNPRALPNVPQRLRTFHPDDVHMTVCFLGKLQPSHVESVRSVMKRIVFTPFDISFGQLIPLPNRKRFSAISLELVNGRQQAVQMIQQWREPLAQAAEIQADKRPALPHATIARPHRKASFAQRQMILDWMAEIEFPPHSVLVDRVVLYTWAEDRTKRQFRFVEESVMGR